MSIVTFLHKEKLTVNTGKLVYSPGESLDLHTLFVEASRLSELLEQEEARIEAAEKQAYDKGYELGQAQGYEAALEHIAVKLVALSKEADDTRRALESKSSELALSIVERIADEMGTAKTLSALAASAARQIVPREPVVLRVSVENLESVEDLIQSKPAYRDSITEVTGDPSLKNDDCILETEFGQIKANLDTQLHALRAYVQNHE